VPPTAVPTQIPWPTSTVAPTAVPTQTPQPTSQPPAATETVPLIAGCSPVVWTGVHGTPIGTVAGAVSPAGSLVALWAFDAGLWLGYSPQFPEVSDLTQMNRLDVAFVCMNVPGTFTRPLI